MTAYRNFTVDFPARVAQLDASFRPLAVDAELDVSYLVMKLAATCSDKAGPWRAVIRCSIRSAAGAAPPAVKRLRSIT